MADEKDTARTSVRASLYDRLIELGLEHRLSWTEVSQLLLAVREAQGPEDAREAIVQFLLDFLASCEEQGFGPWPAASAAVWIAGSERAESWWRGAPAQLAWIPRLRLSPRNPGDGEGLHRLAQQQLEDVAEAGLEVWEETADPWVGRYLDQVRAELERRERIREEARA